MTDACVNGELCSSCLPAALGLRTAVRFNPGVWWGTGTAAPLWLPVCTVMLLMPEPRFGLNVFKLGEVWTHGCWLRCYKDLGFFAAADTKQGSRNSQARLADGPLFFTNCCSSRLNANFVLCFDSLFLSHYCVRLNKIPIPESSFVWCLYGKDIFLFLLWACVLVLI